MDGGTTYAIDFGLNLDVGVERIGFPLSAGLVGVSDEQTGEGKPAWFTQLASGDRIAFRVWDHTVSTGRTAEIVCLRATWVDPDRWNDLSSPLVERDPNPIVFSGMGEIHRVALADARSSVFPQARGGWLFGDTGSAPLGETFEIGDGGSSAGRYYLRLRLDVVIDDATIRTYHWDPEIVVSPRGGEPPPSQVPLAS